MATTQHNHHWRQPTPQEVQPYFQRYQQHMMLDFDYNNEMSFSPEYLDLILREWAQVAKIVSNDPRHSYGGFVTLEKYKELSVRMKEHHGIESWSINDEEYNVVAQEFVNEGHMSLRRFCLYVEQEELYDEGENALRLIQPQDYYNVWNPGREKAYVGPYEDYRLCCQRQLAVDLEGNIRKADLREACENYVAAFEEEDPRRTGYIYQNCLMRILRKLSKRKRQPRQPALQLLQRASQEASQYKLLDELDATLRVDSEFVKNVDQPLEYRVNLRQFCTFVERPAYDYVSFPTQGFEQQLKSREWSPNLHRLLCRYFRNTLFQRQVLVLLLLNRRGSFSVPLGNDVLYTIVSFLPRELTVVELPDSS